ncbi:GGDEF domain-containing protein [Clostridium grantii]|uniref:Diguanylate cyclase (GGDEF) domain-containing protein n=1 Tax=Clostridium grantii DSM 8605 TaxID=1121316 RepID=A0A1M5V4Q4_9CLOT|nr:diguanylate cyclase [Clostridium grantii]SHH70150.1 diguanylate cyclase (GGDEF) domain-containing protein [Clostridium grantii DSM 8605]
MKDKTNISSFAQFKQKDMEQEFYTNYIGQFISKIGIYMLIFISLYCIFYVIDFYTLKDRNVLNVLLIIRILVILCSIIFGIVLKKIKEDKRHKIVIWITIYEILFCIIYLYMCFLNYSTGSPIHYFESVVIVATIFLVPNKWINSFMVSIGMILFYLAITFNTVNHSYMIEALYISIYTIVTFVFISVLTFKLHCLKRELYLKELDSSHLSIINKVMRVTDKKKFHEEYRKLFQKYDSQNGDMALIIFSINEFEGMKDLYGNKVIETLMKEISVLLRMLLRDKDLFAHWAEETFVLLIPEVNNRTALKVTKRIQEGLFSHYFEKVGKITCSFAVASPHENESMDDLLVRIENYLGIAKENKDNEIIFD